MLFSKLDMRLPKRLTKNLWYNFRLTYFKKTDYNYICTTKRFIAMKQGTQFPLIIEK